MAQTPLESIEQAFAGLLDGSVAPHAFSALARQQATRLDDALPPRFFEVLNGLLDRLESAALFDAESCSFSQQDLHSSLRLWLDTAAKHLARGD